MAEKTVIPLGKKVRNFVLQDQGGRDFVLSKRKK